MLIHSNVPHYTKYAAQDLVKLEARTWARACIEKAGEDEQFLKQGKNCNLSCIF